MSSQELLTASNVILDSLSDGVYVWTWTRKIVFWRKATARITSWESTDVVGRPAHHAPEFLVGQALSSPCQACGVCPNRER